MNSYELISPKTDKPCGVFACGVCNRIVAKKLIDTCCAPCKCGQPSRNRFECRCDECANADSRNRRQALLDKAEEIEWDGEMMLLSTELVNSRDGWYANPDEVLEELAERETHGDRFERPVFVFASRKMVRGLDLGHLLEQMCEDTFEDAGDSISDAAVKELQRHVDKFNEANAITYYEPDYSKKVRI